MSDNPTPEPWIDAEAWGIERSYRGFDGQPRQVEEDSIALLLAAMGARDERPAEGEANVWVLREGESPIVNRAWTLVLEDGSEIAGSGNLPGDLALGYHDLMIDGRDEPVSLIVAPSSCIRLDQRRWGWALQLYALRSQKSWGVGDLGDLADFGTLAAAQGASLTIVNPLHAAMPGTPQDTSPYFPSSREFRNLLYLRIESIDGADSIEGLDDLIRKGNEFNKDSLINRDAIWRVKQDALELIWKQTSTPAEFDDYLESQGEPLRLYAAYCAIAEEQGNQWSKWESGLRHPSSLAVQAFVDQHADRIRFYQWVQWLIDVQLERAGSAVPLVQDLAIGVNPSGADAWIWQDAMALGVRVGAPPDEFNTRGQDWGLPPFDPWKLRTLRFEPFIRTVRAGLRHAGGLRIDHVMGLFRLYWIPEGKDASQGTYVHYPWEEMLAIVALESHRAGAYIVGEDLGTVEHYMREQLQAHNILSYKLLWFEGDPPAQYSEQSLAAITTHDLPTIIGQFSGEDLARQQELGMKPDADAMQRVSDRVGQWLGIDSDTPDDEMVLAATKLLMEAPSVLVAATVEDALGLRARPNYPGTVDEWPNWSVPLPVGLEDLPSHKLFSATAEVIENAYRTSNRDKK